MKNHTDHIDHALRYLLSITSYQSALPNLLLSISSLILPLFSEEP